MHWQHMRKIFVAEYLKDRNAKQAAIRAGYSERTAESQASRLLRNVKVKAEVDKHMQAVVNRLEISAERVLKERARLAFFDVRKLLDAAGNPLPLQKLDDDTAAAIAGIDVQETGGGDEVVSLIKKYKLADKNASLTALEKHLGLYKDGTDGDVPLSIYIHLGPA